MADTPPARGDNVFTRKIGPLPMWAWVAIIAVPLLGYGLIKSKKAGTSTTGTGTSSTTNASQVPQLVNQYYSNTAPPVAPTNSTPPTGEPGPPGAHPPRPQPAGPGGEVPPVGGIYVPPGQVNVPNILWGPLSDAVAVIQSRGLKVSVPPHSGNPVVIRQSPTGGLNVAPGSTVTLGV